jgi:hypothetical protein
MREIYEIVRNGFSERKLVYSVDEEEMGASKGESTWSVAGVKADFRLSLFCVKSSDDRRREWGE